MATIHLQRRRFDQNQTQNQMNVITQPGAIAPSYPGKNPTYSLHFLRWKGASFLLVYVKLWFFFIWKVFIEVYQEVADGYNFIVIGQWIAKHISA